MSRAIKLTPESCDFGEQHKRIRRSAELFTPGGQERVQGQVNRVINEGEVARQVSSHATRPAAPAVPPLACRQTLFTTITAQLIAALCLGLAAARCSAPDYIVVVEDIDREGKVFSKSSDS